MLDRGWGSSRRSALSGAVWGFREGSVILSKRIWIALGVFVLALLGWVLPEPITQGMLWLWGLEETERSKIKDIVQIFAGVATVGSLGFAALTFFKHQKNKPKDSRILLKNYYQALHQSCEKIDLALVNVKFTEYASSVRNAITLPTIYQEMDVIACNAKKQDANHQAEADEYLHQYQERQPLMQASAEDEHQRVIVLGDPGAGKSMFMDHLAWQVAGSHIGKTDARLPQSFRRLPLIRLRLRTLTWWCKQHGFASNTLLEAMQREVGSLVGEADKEATWQILKADLLQEGIILLDGLDEVPETDGMRKQMLEAIDDLLKQLQPKARLMISSRPYVFTGDYAYWLAGFSCLELQGMDNEQIEQFITHWYLLLREARQRDEATSRQLAYQLYVDLSDRDYLLEPARRPLILTLLTTLHFAYGILPHSRAELYKESIDLMLERWTSRASRENQDYPLEDFEKKALAESESTRKTALQALALEAHHKHTLQISEVQIKGLFANHLSADCNPNNLLDFLRFRSGLLKPGEGRNFEFYHRSFQAYLAALAITDLDNWQDEMDRLLREDGKDWWGEVFLLLVSAKIAGNSKPEIISYLTSYYVPEVINDAVYTETDWQLLLLAAQATLEQNKPLQAYQSKAYTQLLQSLEKHLLHLVQGAYHLPVKLRAAAGRLLGELGDPRQGVTTIREGQYQGLPDIAWVQIPAGTLRMGSEENDQEARYDEKPAHDVMVEAFQISCYPITNAQYACFVQAGGYQTDRYWRVTSAGLDWWQKKQPQMPPWWNDRPWNNPNHPVVGVSWYESLAFCAWLNETGLYQGVVRLPREEEWEYAARGQDGWRYAWGREPNTQLGNYAATGIHQTSSVGLFPAAKAFQAAEDGSGVYDLSGNVWEWTSSRWGKGWQKPDYTYQQWNEQQVERAALEADADMHRTVRGGSWFDDTEFVRCAVRIRYHPAYRNGIVGFRVLLNSP